MIIIQDSATFSNDFSVIGTTFSSDFLVISATFHRKDTSIIPNFQTQTHVFSGGDIRDGTFGRLRTLRTLRRADT